MENQKTDVVEAVVTTVPEEELKQELAKVNVTEATIALWKKEFLNYKVTDEKSLALATNTRKMVRDTRLLTTKFCEKGRADALKIQKDWIAAEKKIVTDLKEIEDHLKAEEDRVEQEAEQRKIERKLSRAKLLSDHGVTFDGQHYIFKGEPMAQIMEVSDAYFDEVMVDVKAWHENQQEAARLEAERVAKERQEMEAKAEEQRQKEAALAERERKIQEAEEKLAQEKAQAAEREKARRKDAMILLGFSEKKSRHTFMSHNREIDFMEIYDGSAERFDRLYAELKEEIEKEQAEYNLWRERSAKLQEIGMVQNGCSLEMIYKDLLYPEKLLTTMPEEGFNKLLNDTAKVIADEKAEEARLQKEQEDREEQARIVAEADRLAREQNEAEKKAAEAERLRQELLPDAEKLKEWIGKFTRWYTMNPIGLKTAYGGRIEDEILAKNQQTAKAATEHYKNLKNPQDHE